MILQIIEFDEGLAIIEDEHGLYCVTADDPAIVPLEMPCGNTGTTTESYSSCMG